MYVCIYTFPYFLNSLGWEVMHWIQLAQDRD